MNDLSEHGFKLIKQGAEARLYVGTYLDRPTIVKERFKKLYRHPMLDAALTKERTRNEIKCVTKAASVDIRIPTIYHVDYAKSRIFMEYFEKGVTVKQCLIDGNRKENLQAFVTKVGKMLAELHKNNIIHGDLTTSNMLVVPADGSNERGKLDFQSGDLVLIDFGLSYISNSAEDKAVDMYVLNRALTSTHSELTDLFKSIFKEYEKQMAPDRSKEIVAKFKDVEFRGRKRTMVG